MKRRTKTGGDPVKTWHRKAATRKRRNGPKAVRRQNSSATSQETEVVRLTRELHEAREQQTATTEVLSIISSSPGELEPVFRAMLKNATRICAAQFANMALFDGRNLRMAANAQCSAGIGGIANPQSNNRPRKIGCRTCRKNETSEPRSRSRGRGAIRRVHACEGGMRENGVSCSDAPRRHVVRRNRSLPPGGSSIH